MKPIKVLDTPHLNPLLYMHRGIEYGMDTRQKWYEKDLYGTHEVSICVWVDVDTVLDVYHNGGIELHVSKGANRVITEQYTFQMRDTKDIALTFNGCAVFSEILYNNFLQEIGKWL